MEYPEHRMTRPDQGTGAALRGLIVDHCKTFKTAWLKLGQTLYPVWKDKMFYAWGFEKFEYYAREELGLKKEVALRLLKTYFFIEQREPAYLDEGFAGGREAVRVPGCDEINVLRLASAKRELKREDYQKLKKAVFEQGRDASLVRKDLVALMRERKEIDPDEERQERCEAAVRRLATALKTFSRDMEALKLASPELLEDAKALLQKLGDKEE